jgi:hypothetical protein
LRKLALLSQTIAFGGSGTFGVRPVMLVPAKTLKNISPTAPAVRMTLDKILTILTKTIRYRILRGIN